MTTTETCDQMMTRMLAASAQHATTIGVGGSVALLGKDATVTCSDGQVAWLARMPRSSLPGKP